MPETFDLFSLAKWANFPTSQNIEDWRSINPWERWTALSGPGSLPFSNVPLRTGDSLAGALGYNDLSLPRAEEFAQRQAIFRLLNQAFVANQSWGNAGFSPQQWNMQKAQEISDYFTRAMWRP